MSIEPTLPRKPRNLASTLVESLGTQIRDGRLAVGDKLPTESAIMTRFGVSRAVVREAISKLQASGLVQTRHGIGTFVLEAGDAPSFKITSEQVHTLRDVIAVLELRIGVETEAAALAAQRREEANLTQMRQALAAITESVDAGRDAVAADFGFHLEIARASQNPHFVDLLLSLGTRIIPRARLGSPDPAEDHRQYLHRINGEHESILEAIANRDSEGARAAMRTHLANSRERRRRAQANIA
jgi:DNA-binding FadR family transcriptional regulator